MKYKCCEKEIDENNSSQTLKKKLSWKLVGFISLTIIIIPLFVLAFTLAPLYSPPPKLSKNKYIEKCENITYEELARNPISHKGNNYTITGEILQIQEISKNKIQILINITKKSYDFLTESYWEDIIYITYKYKTDSENRFLVGDIITVYGECQGSKTYITVLGSSNTVPYINALYVEIHK